MKVSPVRTNEPITFRHRCNKKPIPGGILGSESRHTKVANSRMDVDPPLDIFLVTKRKGLI